MHEAARGVIADPLGVAIACGNLAVKRHGPFRVDIRPARGEQLEVRSVLAARQVGAQAKLDRDSGAPQQRGPLPRDLRERVLQGDDDASNPGVEDRVGTRRRLAMVAARLQCHVQRRAPGGISGSSKSVDLGVGVAVLLVPAFADPLTVAHDHGADKRVGLD